MSFWPTLLGPRQHFEGGLFLPDYKSVTARRPIDLVAVDGPLHVPLQVTRDLPTVVEVRAGARVKGGQRLARSAGHAEGPVHAPTSGTITAIDRTWTARDGFLPCAVLEPDGKDALSEPSRNWASESFIGQLAACGVVCGMPRGPLHDVIRQAVAAGVTDIIVNAMETEPYLTADLRSVVEHPGRLIDATCEIGDALGASRVIFALPFRHRRVVKRIEAEAAGRYVEVAALANRYPQCHPTILVQTLLDREVPPGGSTLDAETLVLPLAAVRAAADALLDCRPVTHTVMAVAGDAVEHPGTYRVAVGTPMRRLAQRVGLLGPVAQAISGGPLTGVPLGREDAVVTADTTALLLFSRLERANPVPCIHCGWCVEDCPVGLNPSELMQLESQTACDVFEAAQLQACIDCALCSHVCPTQLPLAASIKRSRSRLVERAKRGVEATV